MLPTARVETPVKAVIFDLDGTLIDSLADIITAINVTRRELAMTPKREAAVRAWVGRGAEYLVRGAMPEIPEARVPELALKYIENYKNLKNPETRVYPGARETLLELQSKRGLKLGVVTNKASVNAEESLRRLLPEIHFAVVAGPEKVSARKPNPAHLLETLEKISVAPSEAVFVGDDPVDLECAAAARVTFFGALYGIGGVKVPSERALGSLGDLVAKIYGDRTI